MVPTIIGKMNEAGIKCFHPDDCPSDLNADIILLSVPTPLIKETQRLDMKVPKPRVLFIYCRNFQEVRSLFRSICYW